MTISEHKPMSEPFRRVEIFTGAGRRRTWSAADKAAIVAESYGAGETVCAVARRHGLSPQQLFTWRRLARGEAPGSDSLSFVPAVVDNVMSAASSPGVVSGIELRIGGADMRIGPDACPAAITAAIRALMAAS